MEMRSRQSGPVRVPGLARLHINRPLARVSLGGINDVAVSLGISDVVGGNVVVGVVLGVNVAVLMCGKVVVGGIVGISGKVAVGGCR